MDSKYLNSLSTFLCSDVDTNPTKYVGFQVYNNFAYVYYKTNASGTYIVDVAVSIQPGSDNTTGNKGIYYVTYRLFSPKCNMVQQGSYCTLANQLSNSSNPNFDMFNIPYSYIQHNNSNLSANNVVSTYYKADTTRNNTSDATITVYQNPGVGTLENKGRIVASSSVSSLTYLPCVPVKLLCVTKRLDASSFEPSCNIIQTGSLCKTVPNASGSIFINHFNNNNPTV